MFCIHTMVAVNTIHTPYTKVMNSTLPKSGLEKELNSLIKLKQQTVLMKNNFYRSNLFLKLCFNIILLLMVYLVSYFIFIFLVSNKDYASQCYQENWSFCNFNFSVGWEILPAPEVQNNLWSIQPTCYLDRHLGSFTHLISGMSTPMYVLTLKLTEIFVS